MLGKFIDFAAIGSDDENAQIFRSDIDPDSIQNIVFQGILTAGAIWIAWFLIMRFSAGRVQRKDIISWIVIGVMLYFVYTKVIVGFLPDLPSLKSSAQALQAIIAP